MRRFLYLNSGRCSAKIRESPLCLEVRFLSPPIGKRRSSIVPGHHDPDGAIFLKVPINKSNFHIEFAMGAKVPFLKKSYL